MIRFPVIEALVKSRGAQLLERSSNSNSYQSTWAFTSVALLLEVKATECKIAEQSLCWWGLGRQPGKSHQSHINRYGKGRWMDDSSCGKVRWHGTVPISVGRRWLARPFWSTTSNDVHRCGLIGSNSPQKTKGLCFVWLISETGRLIQVSYKQLVSRENLTKVPSLGKAAVTQHLAIPLNSLGERTGNRAVWLSNH